MSVIEDGTGSGYKQKVDEYNRAHTRSVTFTEQHDSNERGNAYNINSGTVTLTTANDSAILYVKNNETTDLHITDLIVGLGPSTGGTGGIPVITIYRNPTGGTIVSGATAASINSNRNFGSANSITVDAYKGDGTALTLTGGEDHITSYQTTSGRAVFTDIDLILPPGTSIGVLVNPQASNTSMNTYAAIVCYLREIGV